MTDEIKKSAREQVFPEPTVGPIIYNDKNEILLIRSPKWGEMWHIPGGHVELGETSEEALKREIMEETGLEIDQIEFIGWQDAVYPKSFHKKRHFVFLDFCARMSGGTVTKSDEMSEYVWVKPEEALEKYKIDEFTIKTIEYYIAHLKRKEADKQCEEYKFGWQRAVADYQNLQKETAARRVEFAQMSERQILEEFIPVYDHFKLAFRLQTSDYSPEQKKWVEGIGYIMKQFGEILKAHNVEEIKTIGEKFDPRLHEAAGACELALNRDDSGSGRIQGDNKTDIIVEEVDGGYKMGDKVIKPARVIISK